MYSEDIEELLDLEEGSLSEEKKLNNNIILQFKS